MSDKLHLLAGSSANSPYSLVVTPESVGWRYSGLRVLELAPGASYSFATGEEEMVLLPLAGSCEVSCADQRFELLGRGGVFDAVSDLVYLPRDAEVAVSSPGGGRFALPSARCSRRLDPRYRPAQDVPVELRGAGSCSRQVVNFCSADWPYADKLIAVEVLTPGGNWSSYPPHKHDEERADECELEEIYYFEVSGPTRGPAIPSRATASPATPKPAGERGGGVAYQRVYGTEDRPLDLLAEVRTGDVVLIPHGWHGPSMAAPGYHLYYLNVMAGPGPQRRWLVCDDPAHAWVRGTWASQPVDPRLPLTTAHGRSS